MSDPAQRRAGSPGSLESRAVIVTGAGQGLGRAIAEACAREGAHVLVADLDPTTGAATAAAIVAAGGRASSAPTDVRDEDSVAAAIQTCMQIFGRVDTVVNNASVLTPVSLRRMTVRDWDAVMDVHLKGSWLMMRAAAVPMRTQGAGTIVNISSIVAKTGGVGQGHYAAAKAGLIALTKSAALEWGRDGVRVNAVCPGLFRTPTADTMSPAAWQARLDRTPLGRAGEARELADAVVYLAGERSSFVTGAVLEVTGGRDM